MLGTELSKVEAPALGLLLVESVLGVYRGSKGFFKSIQNLERCIV